MANVKSLRMRAACASQPIQSNDDVIDSDNVVLLFGFFFERSADMEAEKRKGATEWRDGATWWGQRRARSQLGPG